VPTKPLCRRCGGELQPSSSFCGKCGTRQTYAANARGHEPLQGSSPGWFADPFHRHAYRYWNGDIWTEGVYSESGSYALDVLSLDYREDLRAPDGAWQASFGSLMFSFGGLLIAFGLSFLFILPLLLLGHPGGNLALLVVSEAGLWTGLFGTCVLSSRRYGTGKVRADFRLRFRWIDLLISFGGAIVARCFAALVLLPFIHVFRTAGNPDHALDSVTQLGTSGWIVLILLSCVGAPLFEELFFRGLLQGQLVERFGPGIAIAVTAIFFGAAHIANDPGIAGLLLALSVGAGGVVLGVVRHFTGRLGSSIATHALFNVSAVVALAFVASR
jgi:membrane protease YdiL (CAAX protease family)